MSVGKNLSLDCHPSNLYQKPECLKLVMVKEFSIVSVDNQIRTGCSRKVTHKVIYIYNACKLTLKPIKLTAEKSLFQGQNSCFDRVWYGFLYFVLVWYGMVWFLGDHFLSLFKISRQTKRSCNMPFFSHRSFGL